jgi:hypothetical protein
MKLTPIKAIRQHCIECSGDSTKEVKICELADCPLYPYRMGHNPARKGMGSKDPFNNRLKEMPTQLPISDIVEAI